MTVTTTHSLSIERTRGQHKSAACPHPPAAKSESRHTSAYGERGREGTSFSCDGRHLTPASFRCPSRHDLPSAPGLHQMLRLAVHSSPTRHTAHLYPTTCTRWGNGHDRAAGLAQAGLGGDCACRTVTVSLTAASSGRRSRSSSVAHTCTRSVALRALALMNLLTNFISLSLAR